MSIQENHLFNRGQDAAATGPSPAADPAKVKPNLFLVGAPKCGTISFHDSLGQQEVERLSELIGRDLTHWYRIDRGSRAPS